MVSIDMDIGLTYDDVLLKPKKTSIISRKDVSLETRLTKKIKLNNPLISANMDSVTEAEMAIAMAREGGIGIIHRYLTIEQQVEEVKTVKRSRNAVIEEPYILNENNSLRDVRQLNGKLQATGFLVVDNDSKISGILTKRDIKWEENFNKKIKELMTPKSKLITASPETSIEKAMEILKQHKIEKLPLVDEKGKIHGLITSADIDKQKNFPHAAVDKKGRFLVGAAVGVKDDVIERTHALLEAGTDVIVIDIAHGHSDNLLKTAQKIRKEFPDIQIIGGNIATAEAADDLIAAGVDAVKVGVGPGSTCTTRIVTGAGYPQMSAVIEAVSIAKKLDIPVIADGGIKHSGDIVKALAAGAETIMSGNLFAGTDESPGKVILRNGKRFKVYRGMASFGANSARALREIGEEEKWEQALNDTVPEGIESTVAYKGPVTEAIHQLLGGIRSGMSYCGAKTIPELHLNAKFVKISSHGIRESNFHDVNLIE